MPASSPHIPGIDASAVSTPVDEAQTGLAFIEPHSESEVCLSVCGARLLIERRLTSDKCDSYIILCLVPFRRCKGSQTQSQCVLIWLITHTIHATSQD